MNLEIVTIGDELLLGFTVDTNAAHIGRELAALGVRIVRRTTCGDDANVIAAAVREALDRTGAVITTGGLGPTADDKTKPAIASIFGRRMVLDEKILARLEQRWRDRFGHEMPVSNRQQAQVPEGCTILGNGHGSAPGIWLEDKRGRWVAMFPGVPRELRGMLADTLIPFLRERLPADGLVVRSRTLRTANIAESALADRLGELAAGVNGLPLAFIPGNDGVDLRLTSWSLPALEAEHALDTAACLIRTRVGRFIYGDGADDLAAIMLGECEARGLTLATAESCTGGMLAERLTSVSGASRSMQGGVIAYANEVKTRELGIPSGLLVSCGAVSEEVARAMASGVRRNLDASIGIGITGIAGPDGGTPDKPVGTVWVAVDLEGTVRAVRGRLPGNRFEIRYRATQLALDLLRRMLSGDAVIDAPAAEAGWVSRG